MHNKQLQYLIIGIGNTLRGDDGAGPHLCSMLQKLPLPGLTLLTVHQADTALLPAMEAHDVVILADASLTAQKVLLQEILDYDLAAASTASHQTPAVVLAGLLKQLYNHPGRVFTCAIPAVQFEMGSALSKQCAEYVEEAVEELLRFMHHTGNLSMDDKHNYKI